MTPFDIYVDSKAARSFKRRAVAAFRKKVEYMEAVSIKRGVGEFHVVEFHRLRLTRQAEDVVEYDVKHYAELRAAAKAKGLEFGSVHTHIYSDSAPSEWDHKESVADGDVLVGVCFLWTENGRTKTKIDFWQPQLPCKLKVIRS